MSDDLPDPRSRHNHHRTLALVLAGLCVLALAATIALGVWLVRATQESSSEAAERTEVVQAAERFTETWNTFEAAEADKYVERVAPLLSTSFRAEFEESAENVLTGMIDLVVKNLKKGARIRLVGLGILQVRKRAARMGRNPATGEPIKIKASKKIAFRPAKELKEAV